MEEVNDQKEILKETNMFYQKLYSAPSLQIDIIKKISHCNFNKLTNSEAEELEGETMKNDKSPGSDGFTAEFLKFFWIDIRLYIVRSINYSYNIKGMSNAKTIGYITCIPKPNKSKNSWKTGDL